MVSPMPLSTIGASCFRSYVHLQAHVLLSLFRDWLISLPSTGIVRGGDLTML